MPSKDGMKRNYNDLHMYPQKISSIVECKARRVRSARGSAGTAGTAGTASVLSWSKQVSDGTRLAASVLQQQWFPQCGVSGEYCLVITHLIQISCRQHNDDRVSPPPRRAAVTPPSRCCVVHAVPLIV